ncbi:MAG: sigma-70 family RNA polymerase sigma factor [Chloroflexia bacterium]|nr:sigma-70 family RNA polymerase sigma factor [Chloroflexia bacterium]
MQLLRQDARHETDTGMLAACLEGDQQAWDLLVERYTRLVYSIALKSGLGEQDAADVVQNVFTIVLRRLESLQQPDRFSAWLITTTHRESWRFKKAQREIGLADGVDPVDPDPAAEELAIEWEHASLTHQALHAMDERCQRLLTMLFLYDERPGYESISIELGVAVGSIGPIRARCLRRLKKRLAEVGIVDAHRT